MIIGQDRLLKFIDNLSLDSMPRSLIIEGYEGSGKHLICDYLSKHLKLTLLDITEHLDTESIDSYYMRSEPYLYLIDSGKLTIKNQNTILKFLEEPLKNSYIIILTTNRYKLLETIINRAQLWRLDNYPKELLKQFSDNLDIIDIAVTPGDILKLKSLNIKDELSFIDKMIDKMNIAAFPNALTLSNHIGFNDEQDKISLNLFLRITKKLLGDKIKSGMNLYEIYKLTNDTLNKLSMLALDKKYLFDNYITGLWYITHKGTI